MLQNSLCNLTKCVRILCNTVICQLTSLLICSQLWYDQFAIAAMKRACMLKFSQNPNLLQHLLSTQRYRTFIQLYTFLHFLMLSTSKVNICPSLKKSILDIMYF